MCSTFELMLIMIMSVNFVKVTNIEIFYCFIIKVNAMNINDMQIGLPSRCLFCFFLGGEGGLARTLRLEHIC